MLLQQRAAEAVGMMAALYDDRFPASKNARISLVAQALKEHGLESAIVRAIVVVGKTESLCTH